MWVEVNYDNTCMDYAHPMEILCVNGFMTMTAAHPTSKSMYNNKIMNRLKISNECYKIPMDNHYVKGSWVDATTQSYVDDVHTKTACITLPLPSLYIIMDRSLRLRFLYQEECQHPLYTWQVRDLTFHEIKDIVLPVCVGWIGGTALVETSSSVWGTDEGSGSSMGVCMHAFVILIFTGCLKEVQIMSYYWLTWRPMVSHNTTCRDMHPRWCDLF